MDAHVVAVLRTLFWLILLGVMAVSYYAWQKQAEADANEQKTGASLREVQVAPSQHRSQIGAHHALIKALVQRCRAAKLENSKLKLENEQLQNLLAAKQRAITEGQRNGIREHLKRKAEKKLFTDTGVTLLLGVDKREGLKVIREIERELREEQPEVPPQPHVEVPEAEPIPS